MIHEKANTHPGFYLAGSGLGLVGVFSILPYGLTAQKDNREETIIRYEAQYWTEVLLGGGLLLEELKRVERVECQDKDVSGSFTCEFRNPFSEIPDKNKPSHTLLGRRISNTNVVYYSTGIPIIKETAKKYWPADVCGWLSRPVDFNATNPHVAGNFALVKSINGTLFDRSYGAEPEKPIGSNEGFMEREFTMGYIMRVQPLLKPSGSEIRINFYWPITEPILELINNPKVLLRDIVSASMNQAALSGGIPPKFNHHEFSFNTPLALQPALTEDQLKLRERRFLKGLAGLKAGDEVTASTQWEEFTSKRPIPYALNVKRDASGVKIDPAIPPKDLKADIFWQGSSDNPQGWLSINGLSGYRFHSVKYPGTDFEIAWADPNGQLEFWCEDLNGTYFLANRTDSGHMQYLPGKREWMDPKIPKNTDDYPWPYRINFLGYNDSWASVLNDMENIGLLIRYGNDYLLRQPLHLTIYRNFADNEKDVYKKYGYGHDDWISANSISKPQQFFLRRKVQ